MRGGCLLAVGARRARGSNKFSSVQFTTAPSPTPRTLLYHSRHDRRGRRAGSPGDQQGFDFCSIGLGIGQTADECTVQRLTNPIPPRDY